MKVTKHLNIVTDLILVLVIYSPLSADDFCKLSAKTLNDVITEMILVWSVAPALTVNN